MLEVRFDDLTGASPSFRLVEPVGVLEATRAGEVVESGFEHAVTIRAATTDSLWADGRLGFRA
jgi:hypothetical protein